MLGSAMTLLFLSPILSPYVLAPHPLNYYLVPTWVGLSLAIGFAGLPHIRLPSSRVLFALLALSVPALATAIFIGYGAETLTWILLICLLIVFAFNLPSGFVPYVYMLFVFASIVWGLLALIVWFGWTKGIAVHLGNWALTKDGGELAGSFVNRNVFGGLMSCSWIMLVWFWLKRPNSLWLSLAFTAIASIAIATMSRGVLLLLLLASATVVFSLVADKKYRQLVLFIACMVAALLLAQGIANADHSASAGSVISRIQQTHNEGLGVRKIIWLSSLMIWLNHPLIGVGFGQLGTHYFDGQFQAHHQWPGLPDGIGFNISAHNIFLQLMAEGGVPGLIFALLITAILAQRCVRYARSIDSLHWPALMAACMLWVQGMFDLTMVTPHPVFYFGLFFGISVVHPQVDALRVGARRLPVMAALLCIVIFMGMLTVRHTTSWLLFEHWLKSHSETARKNDATHLLQDRQLMPYLVDAVTQEVLKNPARRYQITGMLPYIDRALAKQQMQYLYQGKFLALATAGKYKQACKVGRFIEGQHWPRDTNQAAYARVCKGLPPEGYKPFSVD